MTNTNTIDLFALFAEVTAEATAARLADEAKEDADRAAFKRERSAASRAFHASLRREAGGK